MNQRQPAQPRTTPAQITEPDGEVLRQVIEATQQGLELRSLEDYYRFAQYIHASNFAGEGMTVEDLVLALQLGAELGVPKMAAVQNISVIGKRPAVWGDLMLALCQRSNVFVDCLESFEGTFPNDDFRAVCIAKRRGRADKQATFSVADAKTAGLWARESSSGKAMPWKSYPKRMLKMRARSFSLRDQFPDILLGLYSKEELFDEALNANVMREASRLVADADTSQDSKIDAMSGRQEESTNDAPKTNPEFSPGAPDPETPAGAMANEPARRGDSAIAPDENPLAEMSDALKGCCTITDVEKVRDRCATVCVNESQARTVKHAADARIAAIRGSRGEQSNRPAQKEALETQA